jgi:hypothetical protein
LMKYIATVINCVAAEAFCRHSSSRRNDGKSQTRLGISSRPSR